MNMQFYILDVLGDYEEGLFCVASGDPVGTLGNDRVLEYGGPMNNIYPDDPYEVTMRLSDRHPKNIRLGDYVSVTRNWVMVSAAVVEELKNHNIGDVVFTPFTLLNHKNRVHSKDYSFIVPVQQYDALNEELSDITRTDSGYVIGIDKIVLDSKKMENSPEMFRLNDTRRMVFSEKLVTVLENKYTNFVFDKLDQV